MNTQHDFWCDEHSNSATAAFSDSMHNTLSIRKSDLHCQTESPLHCDTPHTEIAKLATLWATR